MLYIDLDRFKAVNDTLGHPVGDALLRKVAERFKSALRDGDIVARIGGDEFPVIQSDAPQPTAATALATRLIDLISRTYAVDGHMLHIAPASASRSRRTMAMIRTFSLSARLIIPAWQYGGSFV